MSSFEFVFSLFGLVLGLSIAEVLAGFARTVQVRKRVRIGWLTPLLGLVLMIDLVSFWTGAWRERDALRVALEPMLFATLIAGIYYVASRLVFPEDQDAWPVLDAWFMDQKGLVVGAVLGCNLLALAGVYVLHGSAALSTGRFAGNAIVAVVTLLLIFTRNRRLSLALLLAMVALYWVVPRLGAAIDGVPLHIAQPSEEAV